MWQIINFNEACFVQKVEKYGRNADFLTKSGGSDIINCIFRLYARTVSCSTVGVLLWQFHATVRRVSVI